MIKGNSYLGEDVTVVITVLVVASVLALGVTGVAGATNPDHQTDDIFTSPVSSTDQSINTSGDENVSGDVQAEPRVSDIQIDSSSTTDLSTTSSSTSDDLRVTVGKDYDDWSYGSNDTVNIWAGVVNTSTAIDTPKANTDLWVNITRPDGAVNSNRVTTGNDGNVNISYTLADKPDGRYDVDVSGPNISDTESERFLAGPISAGVFPGITDAMEQNRSSTIALLVTENSTPVSGVTRNVTIRYPNGTEMIKEVTTGSDGYAKFEFTPPKPGRYTITSGGAYESFTVGAVVGNSYTNNDIFRDYITTNNDAHINGLLYDEGQAYANKRIFVEIINDSNEVIANISTTTDSFGQFLVTWSPSDNQTGRFDIQINASENNTQVALEDPGNEIVVSQPPSGGGGGTPPSGPSLDLDLDLGEGYSPVVKPGGEINATVKLTENGNPVAGTNVTIGSYYDDQEVPKGLQTVTTNTSGMATITIDIPTSAPDGKELTVRAHAEYNGSLVTRSRDAEIQQFIIDDTGHDSNGEAKYEFIATDPETGAGVAGVPITISGETYGFHATVFGTATATTGSDGTVTINLSRPDYVKGEYHLGTQAPYESLNSFPRLSVQDYTVSVNGLDEYEYDAGETITFNYTTSTSENVSARIVVGTFSDVDNKTLHATRLDAGVSTSFTVPSSVPDDTFYSIEIRTISESGNTSTASESFRVNNTVETCIAGSVSGSDATISLSEIQGAIDLWARGEPVPDTGGETISLSKIQSLIDAWAKGETVSC